MPEQPQDTKPPILDYRSANADREPRATTQKRIQHGVLAYCYGSGSWLCLQGYGGGRAGVVLRVVGAVVFAACAVFSLLGACGVTKIRKRGKP